MTMNKPILCLDFDGVIHSYISGWQGADFIPDPPVSGAMEFIKNAIEVFDVKIYSSRSNQEGGIKAMQNWLRYWTRKELTLEEANTIMNKLNENDLLGGFEGFPTKKPSAMITLDDRAVTFTGKFPKPGTLLEFKPWNK